MNEAEPTEADFVEMAGHVLWLVRAMHERGLDGRQSCIVMGCLLERLLCDWEARDAFVDALKGAWQNVDAGSDARRH
jgi:hypothetical protein